MEQLHNGFTLEFCDGAFPFSTDSVALAGFVKLSKGAYVLDLGSGCGTLGMLLCSRRDDCTVTGIEIDRNAHSMALHNADVNGISDRYSSICADLCDVPSLFSSGQFHVCVSNPPYFTGGPESQALPNARKERLCPAESLFASVAWALRYGGDFFLVHRPERLAELCALGAANKLELKRLCLLRHRQDGPVSLLLLQFRKGARPGLSWEEAYLHEPDGSPSHYYRKLYHL